MPRSGAFADVAFRRVEARRWSILVRDYVGFASCTLLLLSIAQFLNMRRPLSDPPSDYYSLLALGVCTFLVGLVGFVGAALHRRFAPISMLSATAGLLPIYFVLMVFALAWQR